MGFGWKGFEDGDVVPSYSVSSGEGVVSRGRLYFVEGLVIGVVESVATFMFLHAVDERSVSLSIVGRGAVQAGDLVDGVGSKVRRRGSLRLCEEVT